MLPTGRAGDADVLARTANAASSKIARTVYGPPAPRDGARDDEHRDDATRDQRPRRSARAVSWPRRD